jgi:hypothetical protein
MRYGCTVVFGKPWHPRDFWFLMLVLSNNKEILQYRILYALNGNHEHPVYGGFMVLVCKKWIIPTVLMDLLA